MSNKQNISENALRMMGAMHQNGRLRTTEDLDRLGCIELKALGVAYERFEDVWELTARGASLITKGQRG